MDRGTYGIVSHDPKHDTSMKTTSLFDDGALNSMNVMEAVACRWFQKHSIQGVIDVRDVTLHRPTEHIRIAQKHAPHGDLLDFVLRTPRKRRLSIACDVFLQLLTGVHSMHQHGIVHGDIKPNNVVVVEDGATVQVRIIDFGSCQLHARGVQQHNGGCTYIYAPPEVFMDAVTDLTKIDAYSLGAVMHFLVHGNHLIDPRIHHTVAEFRAMHERLRASPPESRREDVPADLHGAIARLLRADPRERVGVDQLFYEMCPEPIAVFDPDIVVSDAAVPPSAERFAAMHRVYDACARNNMTSFPLACNIADRCAHAWRRGCSLAELDACVAVARCVMECDCADLGPDVRVAAMDVLVTLRFDVLSDTCDVVLRRHHAVREVDYEALLDAVCRAGGRTGAIVSAYLNLTGGGRRRR